MEDIGLLKAIDSPIRLTILSILSERELTLSELTRELGEGHYRDKIFRHMEILVRNNLVEKKYDKGTKRITYSLVSREVKFEYKVISVELRIRSLKRSDDRSPDSLGQ